MPKIPGDRGHCPYERRVDGERVTEMLPAREWLARQDKNQLQADEKAQVPPMLPRYSSRDHLHDRNRELCVFDPASPGTMQYIRVTRRRNDDRGAEASQFLQRKDRLLQQQVVEEMESERANELLELRSQGIRTLLAARSRGWNAPGASMPAAAPSAASDAALRARRVAELEQQLKRMRATYEYKGYSALSLEQPPATAPAGAVRRKPLRGGWPVEQESLRA